MSGLRSGREQQPGAALAILLGRWWAARDGQGMQTRESLATRVGVDLATLSRYLDPRHGSPAPLHVIELLHAHLRAPADDLDRARALHAAAVAEAVRWQGMGEERRPAAEQEPTAERGPVTEQEPTRTGPASGSAAVVPEPAPPPAPARAPEPEPVPRGVRLGRVVVWAALVGVGALALGLGVWWAGAASSLSTVPAP
ncbi:hypothetical protein [Streptomyces sp. TRM68367]|uniref:hypothetical protein n=1 Tax=Streptomyces sp. TRM68367 TaxID=2758415 RepID=UPI00165BE0FF|nr:hypothetical protein [Streptomyces sp. TRM68367]MBC9730002.1 hypothetical protein [Streptomyces sp. TRM68367]